MQDISLKYRGTQIKKVVVLNWPFLGWWCNGNVGGTNSFYYFFR